MQRQERLKTLSDKGRARIRRLTATYYGDWLDPYAIAMNVRSCAIAEYLNERDRVGPDECRTELADARFAQRESIREIGRQRPMPLP